ncbi:sec-independent protein translocase protein TATC, chloroplastic-like [Salvia splendens]|uniref:sec-independent protein translocase protein TATC, chloroplastic-like n=1 Tax=Salvia splendens TaxID=180675 RepID=UPI001102ED7B|nr:sec-independent protein translocase protein TATC, chloroplastic-like [Salvia splendens]
MATALIYHPHLSRNMLDFKCSNSYSLSTTLKQTPPNPRSFSSRKLFKRFGRLSCSAVEDVTQKQQEISTTSNFNEASNDAEENPFLNNKLDDGGNSIYDILYPSKELLPDDVEMSVYDHLEELRQRIIVSVLAVGAAIVGCFAFSKDLILILEAPISAQGVRFLQLAPGEFFFTSLKVSGYCGLLIGIPVILYEIIAFVLPGLTVAERRFLGPIVLGSSVLFYAGIAFSYLVLTPAALTFFVSYSEGAVESLWSIDQYFEFVLVLMFSTGLSFQVPVIQLLLGQLGLVSSAQMLSIWRYVVVGSVVAAAVLTPSTDPLTQMLLAGPLMGLYLGGATMVKVIGR